MFESSVVWMHITHIITLYEKHLLKPCIPSQELLAEARYYCMSDLVEVCEGAVRQREPEKDPVCRVPLITSQREEQMLIQSTSKPVVKLLVNRHNNKYSYTR